MDINKERQILSEIYGNSASTIKYLPFILGSEQLLKDFIDAFGGKTLDVPSSYEDFLRMFLSNDDKIGLGNNRKRGIHCMKKYKTRILDTYLNLFDCLENALKTELKTNEQKN